MVLLNHASTKKEEIDVKHLHKDNNVRQSKIKKYNSKHQHTQDEFRRRSNWTDKHL